MQRETDEAGLEVLQCQRPPGAEETGVERVKKALVVSLNQLAGGTWLDGHDAKHCDAAVLGWEVAETGGNRAHT